MDVTSITENIATVQLTAVSAQGDALSLVAIFNS